MRPRTDRPPVLCCRGTRPSQAAKSRPRPKASPVLIAATMPVAMIGPIPGTLIRRWHLGSIRLSSSIALVTVSMRCVQPAPVFIKAEDQAGHPRRYLVLSILENGEERVAKGAGARPDGYSLLDEKGPDLVDRCCPSRHPS